MKHSHEEYDKLAMEVKVLLLEKDLTQVELVEMLHNNGVLTSNDRSQRVKVNNALRGRTKGSKNYRLLQDMKRILIG